jgi:hypothetical protein
MKSYFARLAARATLANAPASPAVNTTKAADPFEQISQSRTSSGPTRIGQSSHSTNESSALPLSRSYPAVVQPKSVHPVTERPAPPLPESLDHSTRLPPKSLPTILTAKLAADIAPQSPAERGSQTVESESPAATPGLARETPPPLIQPLAISPTKSPKSSSDEGGNSPITETERTEGDLAAIQREQFKLLRKADAFMEHLFERRSLSATSPEVASRNEPRNTPRPKSEHDEAPRLQPIQSAPRVFEPDSDQPSLVIGKLTVEVVPPAPASVTPRPQVVVVRGARGSRIGIPSSRRFGLGQF